MTRLRFAAFAINLAAVVGALPVGQSGPRTAPARYEDRRRRVPASLTPELKKKTSFGFDDPHRTKWFFTPQQDKEKKFTRKGVRSRRDVGRAEEGCDEPAEVRPLREGLRAGDHHRRAGEHAEGTRRGKARWSATTTGTSSASSANRAAPASGAGGSKATTFSVNYTLDKGDVVAGGPVLFGSNPAEVKQGPRKGSARCRTSRTTSAALVKSFNADQDTAAKQTKLLPAEIKDRRSRRRTSAPSVGITADKLTADQKATLVKLLQAYADRMPEDLAASDMKKVKETPDAKLYFAYSGGITPGEGYTYRVQGPEFVVEFLNIQADSAARTRPTTSTTRWRRLPTDFALSQ